MRLPAHQLRQRRQHSWERSLRPGRKPSVNSPPTGPGPPRPCWQSRGGQSKLVHVTSPHRRKQDKVTAKAAERTWRKEKVKGKKKTPDWAPERCPAFPESTQSLNRSLSVGHRELPRVWSDGPRASIEHRPAADRSAGHSESTPISRTSSHIIIVFTGHPQHTMSHRAEIQREPVPIARRCSASQRNKDTHKTK